MADQTGFTIGEPMLLFDERDRQTMFLVPEPEDKIRLKDETLPGEVFIALHEGELLVTPQRRRYLVMRPTMGQVVMNMPREAQVIYPKDLGAIMMWGDVAPGQRIVEIGAGHGALTMTLLRALGPEGRLITYDVRLDHLNRTRKNIAAYIGPEFVERWTPVKADPITEGIGERGVDRVFSDMPEPWTLTEAVVEALRPGGLWISYVPTVPQIINQMEAIAGHRDLCLAECFELMQRFWNVRPPSVRPAHSMKAHTGFIMVCRRRWRADPVEETPAAEAPVAETPVAEDE